MHSASGQSYKPLSPVAWQHIYLCGWYEFSKGPEPINVEAIVEVLAQHPLAAVEDEPDFTLLGLKQKSPKSCMLVRELRLSRVQIAHAAQWTPGIQR